jgi:hypothetical protein
LLFSPNVAMSKTPDIPGRTVSLGAYSAFVPDALPPDSQWTPRLKACFLGNATKRRFCQ